MEDLLKKFLLLNNYNIDFIEFNHYFQSHPNYPNLEAVENTLKYFQIENIILEFENEDFESLPDEFITSLKSSPYDLVLAVKENGKILIIDKQNKKTEIKDNLFLTQWTGIVVAIEKNIRDANLILILSHQAKTNLNDSKILCYLWCWALF